MRVGISLLRVGLTYLAAVIASATSLVGWYSFEQPSYVWRANELVFAISVSAAFAIPVFALVGLPYLAFGSWGRDHQVMFVLVGTLLGGLGGAAFGALLAMPLPLPLFMPVAGIAAGAACSIVWCLACRKLSQGHA